MTVSFSHFSKWLWIGKEKEPNGNAKRVNLPKPSKKVKKKRERESRKETGTDWEYDVVIIPSSDAMPDSDDEADWSIGWLEPHGPGFRSEDSFAVLVPSYSNRCKDEVVKSSNMELLNAIKNLQNEFQHVQLWSLFNDPAIFEE